MPVLLIALMILIFCLSAQTATESSGTSGNFISVLISFFDSSFDELSEAEQEAYIEPFQFIVRKGAHFSAYALMGALALLSVITYRNINIKCRYIISCGVCLLYAVSDEFHQHFVAGRSCELRDVLIDFSGVLFATLILSFVLRLKRFKKFV